MPSKAITQLLIAFKTENDLLLFFKQLQAIFVVLVISYKQYDKQKWKCEERKKPMKTKARTNCKYRQV